MQIDTKYMQRAIALAYKGLGHASPNPMVGAVIVAPDGRIIGEGYHRKCGGPHAEVNAINSVKDQSLLKDSTMYVTLEPCAHYGRTGPCSDLIIEKGIPRVAIGCRDPFCEVDGRGIERLKNAGVEVKVGVLEYACRALNALFFTAHTLHRPFIMLKWAQSRDGFMDIERSDNEPAAAISSTLTRALNHRLRSMFDAILIGSGTALADNPSLTTRNWVGDSPRPVILDRRGRLTDDLRIMQRNPIVVSDDKPIQEIMTDLYNQGITSLIVEGGAQVLQTFLDARLWDVMRVEKGPMLFAEKGVAQAPIINGVDPVKIYEFEGQTVKYYSQNPLIDVKNL